MKKIIFLCCAFCFWIAPVQAAPLVIEPSQVNFVQFLLNGRRKNLVCLEQEPGTLSSTAQLKFKSLTDQIRSLRARDASADLIKEKVRLRKKGRLECQAATQDSTLDQVATQKAYNAAGSVTNLSSLLSNFANAASSETRATSTLEDLLTALQAILDCASITIDNGTLRLDFGSGCTVNGSTFSGAIALTLGLDNTSVVFGYQSTELSVAGYEFNGSGTLTVGNSEIQLILNANIIGSENIQIEFDGTLEPDGTGLVVDGSGTFTNSTVTFSFILDNVHKTADPSCYPDGGSCTLSTSGFPSIKITFSSSTPENGEVQVQIGQTPAYTDTLPECAL